MLTNVIVIATFGKSKCRSLASSLFASTAKVKVKVQVCLDSDNDDADSDCAIMLIVELRAKTSNLLRRLCRLCRLRCRRRRRHACVSFTIPREHFDLTPELSSISISLSLCQFSLAFYLGHKKRDANLLPIRPQKTDQ